MSHRARWLVGLGKTKLKTPRFPVRHQRHWRFPSLQTHSDVQMFVARKAEICKVMMRAQGGAWSPVIVF